jgi:hypothetical protein
MSVRHSLDAPDASVNVKTATIFNDPSLLHIRRAFTIWDMAKQQEGTARKGPSYPYYSWAQSLKVAEAVKSLGGDRAPVSKGDIAHHLEMSEDSQSLTQSIAAARTYGMIEGHGEYTLTDDGKRYFYPENPAEKRSAELSFLVCPAAHEMLIRRFDGNMLPPSRNLGTLLKKFGVPTSWVDRAASQFKDACDRLGLFDNGGHLRYGVAVRTAGRTNEQTPPKRDNEVEPETEEETKLKFKMRETDITVWTLTTASGEVRVETPNPLTKALWERLKRYVMSQEPFDEESEA